MELKIIKISKENVELRLTRNGAVLDVLIIPLDFGFDTVLVTSIDKVLKENRIDKVSPLDIVLEGFEDESSMSSIIAQTVAEALKIK